MFCIEVANPKVVISCKTIEIDTVIQLMIPSSDILTGVFDVLGSTNSCLIRNKRINLSFFKY